MNTYYKFILIPIFIIFFLHLKHYYQNNEKNEILQANNLINTKVEELLYQKLPTIFTNTMDSWEELVHWSPEYLLKYKIDDFKYYSYDNTIIEKSKYKYKHISDISFANFINTLNNNKMFAISKNFIKDNKIDVKNNISNIIGQMMYITENEIYIGKNSEKLYIKTENTYRNLFCQIYGTCKIYLWNPSQRKYLYPDDCYDPNITYSKINFKDYDNKKYSTFNNSKYIEIIMNPGQILYIPPYWWYCIEDLNRNIRMQIRGESYFSLGIKTVFEYWPCLLHNMNLYKTNNCICCEDTDLKK